MDYHFRIFHSPLANGFLVPHERAHTELEPAALSIETVVRGFPGDSTRRNTEGAS